MNNELNQHILYTPHIDLNIYLPDECSGELLKINDFYGLRLAESVSEATKTRQFNTSLGHALRSYAPNKEYAYYTKGSKYLWVDNDALVEDKFHRTETWHQCPKTTEWITKNVCSEDDLGLVCLHKLKAGGWVDWHSHCDVYPYTLGIVHFSLITSPEDLSHVKGIDGTEHAMNYPKSKGFLFNGNLKHKSSNMSGLDRLHLVVECSFKNPIFQNLIKCSLNTTL